MPTLLSLPEVQPQVLRWSVEKYERLAELGLLPRRAELIRGLVIETMPKSPLHCALAKRLYDLFLKVLPPGFVVFQERPLRLADSEPEPDLVVVRGREEEFAGQHPQTAALVVEVAVSSAALDRANAGLYAEAGVQEYWIVLGRERQVEVYTDQEDGVYRGQRVVSAGDMLVCGAVPEIQLRLDTLLSP